MKETVNKAYAIAKERYAAIGVDTEFSSSSRISTFQCTAGRQMT